MVQTEHFGALETTEYYSMLKLAMKFEKHDIVEYILEQLNRKEWRWFLFYIKPEEWKGNKQLFTMLWKVIGESSVRKPISKFVKIFDKTEACRLSGNEALKVALSFELYDCAREIINTVKVTKMLDGIDVNKLIKVLNAIDVSKLIKILNAFDMDKRNMVLGAFDKNTVVNLLNRIDVDELIKKISNDMPFYTALFNALVDIPVGFLPAKLVEEFSLNNTEGKVAASSSISGVCSGSSDNFGVTLLSDLPELSIGEPEAPIASSSSEPPAVKYRQGMS